MIVTNKNTLGDQKSLGLQSARSFQLLTTEFFNRDAQVLAKALLGKVLHVKHKKIWLTAQIIETEAYYLEDKASHASLGYTKKRAALFMPAGTIYMYYARGKDSLNISAKGEGNAVLIKSGIVYQDEHSAKSMLKTMLTLNPDKNTERKIEKLCSGQTLLCQALGLKVPDWDQRNFDENRFFIADHGIKIEKIVQARRLGIALHRDPHHLYRFIDYEYADRATQNPLKARNWLSGKDYLILSEAAR